MAHSGKRAFAFVAIMLALALPTLSQEPDKTAPPESQSQPNSAQPQPPPSACVPRRIAGDDCK